MANKTGDFDVLKLTNAGRDMLTQGRAGHVLTFTKVVIGDGTATGAAIDSLTAIKSPKLTLPIAKNETVHAGQMRLQFRVSNSLVNTSFYFREIGLMAKIDDGQEKLYAYTTCGDKAKLVYDKTYPIQEKIINIDTVTDNAVNVKVILDLSIMYATKKDIVDMIKPHKELAELDHPDSSVTTRKLRDKSVTLPKLADDVNNLLQRTYVKKTGDTMTGNLSLNNSSIGFNNGNNTHDTKIRIASNGNFDIGVTEDSANKNATTQLLLHSQNKPKWYNSANGGKVLATEEYVNTETVKYLPLDGGTMKGDINIATSATIKLQRKAGGGYHTISDGGTDGGATNLDLGNIQYTQGSNLCCYHRPGWYGKDKQRVFQPFLTIPDISVTYGNIKNGEMLPIPSGFTEDECTWLLSMDQSNIDKWYIDFRESNSSNMINFECWREGRKVHVGTRLKGQDGVSKTYNDSTKNNGAEVFLPGSANYICIAVKRA